MGPCIRVQRPQYVRWQLLRRNENAAHTVVLGHIRQAVQASKHRHAMDLLTMLARIIVQETERLQPKLAVVLELANRQLATVASAVNRHALPTVPQTPAHQLQRTK